MQMAPAQTLQTWIASVPADPWLRTLLEVAASEGTLWATASAAAQVVRLRQHAPAERRALTESILLGRLPPDLARLRALADTFTDAEVTSLSQHAVSLAQESLKSLNALLRIPTPHNLTWRANLLTVVIDRDDLAAVLSILRARSAEAPLLAALQPLDALALTPSARRTIHLGLRNHHDERLLRVAAIDPRAWWAGT